MSTVDFTVWFVRGKGILVFRNFSKTRKYSKVILLKYL